jgi:hypothetical protein
MEAIESYFFLFTNPVPIFAIFRGKEPDNRDYAEK